MQKDDLIMKQFFLDGMLVTVVKEGTSDEELLQAGLISEEDMELDRKATEAVAEAIQNAVDKHKPIAVWDRKTREAKLVSGIKVRL